MEKIRNPCEWILSVALTKRKISDAVVDAFAQELPFNVGMKLEAREILRESVWDLARFKGANVNGSMGIISIKRGFALG